MYLAQQIFKGKPHYYIRQSYRHGDNYLTRDLFDLGTNPAKYIIYPGGNSFYFDEIITDRIESIGAMAADDELEDIFRRFLKADIQRALETFRRREKRSKQSNTPKDQKLHPDKGGDHENFVKLTQVYHDLLKTK